MKDLTIHFILSQPRSGSTLLRLILSKAEQVISLPETHFFAFKKEHIRLDPKNSDDRITLIKHWINYHTVKKMNIDLEKLADELSTSADTWKKVFEITVMHYANIYFPSVHNPTFIEKSPPHIFFIDDILEFYPKSNFIHLIRDPRAVIASLKSMPWATSNIYTLCRSWNKSYQLISNQKDVLTLRYEDLASSPEFCVKKLTQFLSLKTNITDYDKGLEDHIEQNKSNQQEIKKPINTKNIDKWKNTLSGVDGDIQLIENMCKHNMIKQNYKLLNLKKNNGYYASKFCLCLQFLILKVLNMIRNRAV